MLVQRADSTACNDFTCTYLSDKFASDRCCDQHWQAKWGNTSNRNEPVKTKAYTVNTVIVIDKNKTHKKKQNKKIDKQDLDKKHADFFLFLLLLRGNLVFACFLFLPYTCMLSREPAAMGFR